MLYNDLLTLFQCFTAEVIHKLPSNLYYCALTVYYYKEVLPCFDTK